jgi:hypothetical protein
MPEVIGLTDFSGVLKKPRLNRNEAKKFLADYSCNYVVDEIILPKHFQLKSNKKQTVIRLIDRTDFDNPRIVYAVDIEFTNEKINQKSCTQILVWASPENEDFLIGFPRKMFNHFLQKYVVMITDKQQTFDGKRFWERRIVDAFRENHFVYFFDKNLSENKLQRIESSDDFFETFEPLGWGNDKGHQNKWFLISLSEINSFT